jgi:hypothetical protein
MVKSSLPKVHRYSMHFSEKTIRLSELPYVPIREAKITKHGNFRYSVPC